MKMKWTKIRWWTRLWRNLRGIHQHPLLSYGLNGDPTWVRADQ